MPAISRNAQSAKLLMCDTMNALMLKEVGEQLVMNFKDRTIIWERIK